MTQYRALLKRFLAEASDKERSNFAQGEVVNMLLDLMNALSADERATVEQEEAELAVQMV